MPPRSGRDERVPYSLSRWTDVPAAKWDWFLASLKAGEMLAVDQRTALPSRWSLLPEETLGLVWWTKNPRNLIDNHQLLKPYRNIVNVTVTGWTEVEKGAPDINEGTALLVEAAKTFGPENVVWRMSPVPVLDDSDVRHRYSYIASHARNAGIRKCFVSFIQSNDMMSDPRSDLHKAWLLEWMQVTNSSVEIVVCNDDAGIYKSSSRVYRTTAGICVDPASFEGGVDKTDGCGCAMMVDPFTINESCTMGCRYCYAADKTLSDQKRNTTRHLPIVRR